MKSDIRNRAPAIRRMPDELRLWRETLLLRAGFGWDLARRLAGDADYDLHELLKLADRGYPPQLAARILARR